MLISFFASSYELTPRAFEILLLSYLVKSLLIEGMTLLYFLKIYVLYFFQHQRLFLKTSEILFNILTKQTELKNAKKIIAKLFKKPQIFILLVNYKITVLEYFTIN